ncbi:ATP-binding cassette domain-containing protein [Streptomyces sp. M19]
MIGPSGAGKSTLLGLVAGLLEPWDGEIGVGGQPVRVTDGARAAARRRVLVPRQPYVFSGTLRDNLRHLREDDGVPDAEVSAAAEAVGLGALLARPGGLDAAVGPAALTAGERQLVALARAYLSPAPLVLLDEATCHLDPAAEARAERAFTARPGTTLIVVAHRPDSARRADRALVMEGGHTTCGRHPELLDSSPLPGAGGVTSPRGPA